MRARSFAEDHPRGVQELHVLPTSRLGGTVLFAAFLIVLAVARLVDYTALAAVLPLALAAIPVVVVGLLEDVTRRIRPRYRMLAAIVSAAVASFYAGGVVPRLDLPFVDTLLQYAWFVLPLTWFMVAGACNAINLIDGVHGLAGGIALMMFGGIALAAGWSEDAQIFAEALAMAGVIAGFLAWNYPHGRVFMGDAGAYFIGFMYAELSIRLITRNHEVSAWYVIMLAGYPIVDTLFSMYRRGVLRGRKLMSPDALHLHSLLFRRVAMSIARRRDDANLQHANARVAPWLWLHGALCFALAVAFHDNTPALLGGVFVYAAFYVHRYRTLVRFGRGRRRKVAATVDVVDS